MKQGTNRKGFPKKPWTIIRFDDYFYALNLVTNERGPMRDSYSDAFEDVKFRNAALKNPWAEPWGL